jgi:Ca2+:H+ antiporter
MPAHPDHLARWAWIGPLAAITILGLSLTGIGAGAVLVVVAGAALAVAVAAAVHHAEVVALRVGEPYGTIVLAVAVTVIEVGLIVMLMLADGPGASALARDTVFAAVMIVSNGILGLCLLVGGLRHGEQGFQVQGASSLLAVLAALVTLTLVLPTFTTSTMGPTYSTSQLIFAGIASLGLYAVFIFVQAVRHRDDFLPVGTGDDGPDSHAAPPSARQAWVGLGMLIASLVAVVGLAKVLAPTIASAVAAAGAPAAVVGIAIAVLVLLPETVAAVRAASGNRLQTSLNLALGSGLATIGLTIPVVAALSIWLDKPLVLGLDPKNLVLLVLTFVVGTLTLGTGRTNVLQGAVHIVILAAFVVLTILP